MRKTKEPIITTEEWLAELERLAQDDPSSDGLTVHEIVEKTGKSSAWVYKHLQLAKAAGRLKVGRRVAESLCGHKKYVPVYQIVPVKK